MPLKRLIGSLTGPDRQNLTDLFTMPAGRVKANSALKKLVRCDDCMEQGALRLVVCTSGGAGNRLTCDWCRCRMTTNTTDAASMWCGKRHSNCRQLVIENESDCQGNTLFLSKGLAPVKEVVPYDELKVHSRGFNLAWCIVRASDVGAPHRQSRWFCAAHRGGPPPAPPAFSAVGYAPFTHRWAPENELAHRTACPGGPTKSPLSEQQLRGVRARLRLLGNSVVPDAARHAFLHLLAAAQPPVRSHEQQGKGARVSAAVAWPMALCMAAW